ncbi:hypothetical protein MNBD_BACTEROID05-996 [hydrothermal vent metagenome]|uniref:Uncharacterized protein n=1 Tax=hydrothermal vent metagenome TaxID=652676 RepID=A0A3B0TAN0_9ZZZZ
MTRKLILVVLISPLSLVNYTLTGLGRSPEILKGINLKITNSEQGPRIPFRGNNRGKWPRHDVVHKKSARLMKQPRHHRRKV